MIKQMKIADLIKELQRIKDEFSFHEIEMKEGEHNYCLECKSFLCKEPEHENFWLDGADFEAVIKTLKYLERVMK